MSILNKAHTLQCVAAKKGFDWTDIRQILEKTREELNEVLSAIEQHESPARIAEEVGDVLFCAVNIARFLKVDPEEALQNATEKFSRRFDYVTLSLKPDHHYSFDELETLWQQAKKETL